jgi:hypothetical protein
VRPTSRPKILSVPVRLRRSGREIRMLIDWTDLFATAKPDARLIKLLIRRVGSTPHWWRGGSGRKVLWLAYCAARSIFPRARRAHQRISSPSD